jgi:tetratricopeptide (TPR) repeat protein
MVEMMLARGRPAPAHPPAPPRLPLGPGGPGGGSEDEETPLDLSFVPATRGRDAAASPEEAPGARRKRLVLWGVIALLLAVLLLLLLAPTGGESGPEAEALPRYPLEAYEETVREGIRLFRQEDFAAAAETWSAADAAWREAHPQDPRPVAAVFADVAEIFHAIRTGERRHVPWADLTEELLDLVNRGYVSGLTAEAFVEDLQRRFHAERRSEVLLNDAAGAMARGEHAEALDLCRRVDGDSLFASVRATCVREAEAALFAARVTNAEEAARAGAWDLAVERAEAALLVRDDPDLERTMETWRENRALAARIDSARRLVAGTRAADITRAIEMLESLPVRQPVTADVPGLLETARERLFLLQAQDAFAAADAERLRSLADRPQAVSPQAAPLFATFRRVERAMAEAKADIEAGRYGEARERWEEVLLLVPEAENVFHARAVRLLEEWSPSRIGRIRLEEAEAAIRAEDYGRAREYLREARDVAQVDTDALEATIRRFGKRLYTDAVNTIINNPSPEAREAARGQLEKALICFEPTDEMYATVKERLDKEFR